MVVRIGTTYQRLDGLAMALGWDNQEKRVAGVQVKLAGVPFILFLVTPTAAAEDIMQHPRKLELTLGRAIKSIRFAW